MVNRNPGAREIGRHVNDYESARKFLGNRQSKRLANNTIIYRTGIHHYNRGHTGEADSIAVKFHSTNIVVYLPNGKILLNNGGHRTRTTAQRINQLLPVGRIEQKDYEWYYVIRGQRIPFSNDMSIDTSGPVVIVDTREGDIKGSGSYGPSETARHIKNPRGPGKFGDEVESMLYHIDHDQEIGSVDELGWYGLVSGLLYPEAEEYVASVAGDIDQRDFAHDADNYDWPLNAIVAEDSDGNVVVETFKENRNAMRQWAEVQRMYDKYYGN